MKVIFDTNIGSDIDDALARIGDSPEIRRTARICIDRWDQLDTESRVVLSKAYLEVLPLFPESMLDWVSEISTLIAEKSK